VIIKLYLEHTALYSSETTFRIPCKYCSDTIQDTLYSTVQKLYLGHLNCTVQKLYLGHPVQLVQAVSRTTYYIQ